MLYVPLGFKNGRTKDALVDSRAYVSGVAETKMDTFKQKGSNKIHKDDGHPNF